ncbi:MAG: exodeoxyribonuclease VII large subunit [Planctomycetota bacterium]|nr:MAG: exodeoxyribonuclease VII large subunit [Planctomycetota bacterium]REK24410.1 MAG: exodeoxyribonuclease VII large subunit [Planctomycetota bacterium]REK38598.1 MAG: exodeoxyribonuclease VII large subunit [Planctomycetota bacterium]
MFPGPEILSVSEVTRQIKDCLEGNFPAVAVRGEISGCSFAGSGHVYLTLKDDDAQLRGVIWRSRASRLKFDLHDGLEVVALGGIDVYPARGSYQLVIEEVIPHGVGPLELAFRQLHDRLAAEGLFAAERKRALPRFPRRIALVTSPQSAAVRDMVQVITRRWPGANLVIVPVPVQGDGAAERIAAGIGLLGEIPDVDVAIVGRGGGSLEDLWSFNEEVVARAIVASSVPIISAVGHEIDVTIADLVADRRALTPSEAGEIVVLDHRELLDGLDHLRRRLVVLLRERAAAARSRLDSLSTRRVFARPVERIHQLGERLDDVESRLQTAIRRRCESSRARWETLSTALDALSPLNVLRRGYSLTTRSDTGEIVREAGDVEAGETVITRVSRGRFTSRVASTEEET